jgi:hypothetical protein
MVVPRTTAVPPVPAEDTAQPQMDYAAALQAYNRLLAMQSPLLPSTEPAPPPVRERATAFGRGVGLEPLQLAYSRAVTQRVFADQFGTPEQAEAARLAEQEAIAEIERFQEVNPSVGLFDIEGVGDVGSFAGEVLGGEAADLAIQLGATGTGAGIGSLAGPGGTAIGAGVGRAVGVGITTYRMLPQLFAEAITAQERAGNDPNIARAAATTVGNAMLEFVTDYFTLIPGGGEAASRIRKAAVTGGNAAITQGGTEALQQVIVRAQAGLPLDNEEAAREIAEAFAAGLVFAAPGAAIGFVSGEGKSAREQRELNEDQLRDAAAAEKDAARAIRDSSAPVEFASVPQGAAESTIALPAPPPQTEAEWRKGFRRYERERARDIKPVSLRALPIEEVRAIRAARQAQGITNQTQLGRNASLSEIQAVLGTDAVNREVQKQKPMSAAETAFAPIENKSFSQQQFDAVLDTVRATGKINFPEVKKVLQKTQRDPVPTNMVNDVLTEASNRGLVERTAKIRKDGGTRFSYQLSPALTAAQTEGSINQKQLSDIQREFAEKQQEITRLQEEARRIEQTGTTLDGKKRKVSIPERKKIARLEADTRSIAARMQDLSARMGLDPAVRPIPALELTPAGERQQQRDTLKAELADQQQRASDAAAKFDLQIIELKKRLSDPQADKDVVRGQISDLQTQRELARSAVLRGQTPAPPPTLRYTPRFQRIANNLRGRLDKLGLTDVGVKLEGLLDRQGSIEGVYSPENRVIRLASALHDSNLSDTQLEARLSEIMDHELVHALWEMGLFTDAERASLIKAAGERQYVAVIDGKPTKRSYTYLQRAQRMYGDQTIEVQQEEAIAEMFRNYASGRDKFAGRPQSVFKRIINFFKSFSKAATQEGAQGPADIFAGIQRGEIGARERAAVPGATERESRRVLSADVQSAQQRLALDPGSLGLTPALVSRVNPIYRPAALPKEKMPSNREAALWLESKFTGVPITDFTAELSPEQIREIAILMAAEAELGLQNSGNAFDWYSSAMAKAIDIASVKYPMLNNDAAAADAGLGNASNAQFVFTYIMAVTSQNMDVAANAKETDTLFGRMLEQIKVGDFAMPASWGTGDKREAMGKNFAKFGPLVRAMPGETFPERIAKLDALFRESKTVKEWEADLKARGIPYSPPGQTAKDAIVYGSSTLGPKIGNGFWQNLNGNYTPLTIDLWMRRTWGRLTGKSIGNPDALPEQRQRFKDAVARSRSRLRGDKAEIARVTGRIEELLVQVNNLKNLDIRDPAVKAQYGSKKNINEQLKLVKNELADTLDVRPDLLGIKAPEVWQTAYNKDNTALLAYAKRSLKPWEAEYKKLSTRLSKEEIADITPTWVRAAKTVVTNLGKPIDQVANGTQRKQIEEAGRQALDILASRGIVLTNADLQAVLWYPEKDLWGSLAADLNVDEDGIPIVEANLLNESYDGAFARILGNQGYDVRGRDGRPTVAGSDARLGRPGGAEGSGRIGGGSIPEAKPAASRPASPADGDSGRDAGNRARPRRPLKESRRPTSRPAAETRVSDLEAVTADDLRRITELGEDFFRRPGWATVSVETPYLDGQELARANMLFKERLEYEGVPYIELNGSYLGTPESSYLIIAPKSTAELYGKQLDQESILTNEGFTYTKRPIAPTSATGRVFFGEEARAQDSVSRIRGTTFDFSMELAGPWPGDSVFPENTYERTDRPQLPIRKSDDMVELLHWSDQPLTSVDPAFAGTGPLVGAERRRGARLGFFGINPRKDQRDPGTGYVKEAKLGSVLHRAFVDPSTLYPWVADPAGFKKNLTTRAPDDQISETEQRIRDAGYLGYYVEDNGNVRNPSAPLGNVAAMFEAIPVEPVLRERESRRPMYSVTATLNAQAGTNNMTAIQKQVTQYTDLSDWFAKGIGIVVRDKTKDRFGRTAAQRKADKFLQTVQDSFLPVGRMIKEMKDRGLTIMDAIDPYLKQQLSRSVTGARIEERKRGIYKNMQEAIKGLNITDANRESLIKASRSKATKGDGLAAHIFDLSGSNSLAVAEIYLYTKHALERNEYVRQIDASNQSGSGMTDAEANAILNWFSSNLSQQNRSAIAQIEAAAKAIVADTNKVRVDGNLIPAAIVNVSPSPNAKPNKEAPNFQNYVPLRGRFDDDDSVDYGITPQGRGFSVSGKEDQALLGRDSYGGNIIANLLFQNQNSIVRAGTNEVALSLVDLMESDPNITKSFGRILERRPQRRILNAAGNVQYTVDQGYKNDPNIVIAKRNGEDIIVELEDANTAGAFNGKNIWDAGHAEKILRFTGKLNRYLSAISTSYNPEFVITNLMRDLQTAGVQVSEFEMQGLRREIFANIPSALKGMKRAIRNEDYSSEYAKKYLEFVNAGGASSANPMQTLEDQIADIDNLMKDLSKGGPAPIMKKNLKRVLDFLEDYNTVVENAVRLTTYDALKKRGFTNERAAQAARSVTVDFTKTGDIGRLMNSLYLFYNASLQGSFFLLRSAARSKRVQGILAGAIVAGFVSDMMNALISDEDEAGIKDYDKFEDWFLEHNWVIMLPGGGRIAIPMPYGLNAFYNTGRSISSAIRRNALDHYGAYDVGDAAKSIKNTLLEVVNPLGGTEHFLNFASPTIADPFISLYGTNIGYDERDIRKEAFPGQRVAASQLYWNSTSPTAVAVANVLNEATGGTPVRSGWLDVSPDSLEFWFDFVTGGTGGFVQRSLEAPYNIATAEAGEDVVRQIPFLRKIYGSVSTREDLGTYIEGRDQLLELRADYRNAVKNRDVERIQILRQNNLEELRIAEAINRIEQTRRKITQRINDITANENIPDEQKRAILERLDDRRQQVITRGLQLMSGQLQ